MSWTDAAGLAGVLMILVASASPWYWALVMYLLRSDFMRSNTAVVTLSGRPSLLKPRNSTLTP